MREAIERVIAELQTEHKRNWEIEKNSLSPDTINYRQGGQDGLNFAIEKLKAVLTQHEANHTRQTRTGSTDDTAE